MPARAVVSRLDALEHRKDAEALRSALDDTLRMPSEGSSGPAALDFWVGEWTCTWEGGGGLNSITRELDGMVVVERFESLEPERWSGMSISVFDERHGWRQTWVDSTGNDWAFRGSPHSEGFAFSVSEVEDGREVERRMVFSGIEADTFDWRWERSEDGGGRWAPLWTIEYHRETEGA